MNLPCGIPLVQPKRICEPWFVAFTTMAPLDFGAGDGTACASARAQLGAALAPLHLTWLTLEHARKVVLIPNSSPPVSPYAPVAAGGQEPVALTANPVASPVASAGANPIADAAIVTQPGYAAALTTADCLPLVVVCPQPHVVAVIHAGWRGLAAGVIERTVATMCEAATLSDPQALRVWVGPAIQREDYEVGPEVRHGLICSAFVTSGHFTPLPGEKYLADLPAMAVAKLVGLGVPAANIERYPQSTKASAHLHSVRRDGTAAGRMATIVGLR
jgi:YfiH family protein